MYLLVRGKEFGYFLIDICEVISDLPMEGEIQSEILILLSVVSSVSSIYNHQCHFPLESGTPE